VQTEIVELTQLAAPKRASFGEFLVEHRVLDRFQLFRALQLQDRVPGTRLGHCAVVLGFAPRRKIEELYAVIAERFDAMPTGSFARQSSRDV
jgi:hypothetical protein